jgi:hypothetical protein
MSNISEADLIDMVRRLRQNVALLDTCNWLVDRVKLIQDPLLNALADEVYARVNQSATTVATLLKHLENNRQYREIVKQYKSAEYSDE